MTQYDTPIKKTKQDIFLEEFGQHGNITMAARAAHVERKTIYRWKENSDRFLLRYNQAFEEAKDNIRHEIYRRGYEGWEESQFSAGKRMGTIRKYSDTLLIFHAKMLMPEYREKQSLEVTTPGAIEIYKIRVPDNERG
jgi:hypothetical protein